MENYNTMLPVKEFYNSRKVPLTEVPTEMDTWFNDGFENYTIEVIGATSIEAQVKGCVNINGVDGKILPAYARTFTALQIIDLSTFKTTDTITKDGIYAVGVAGIQNLYVEITTLSGSVTIVGSQGDWREN